jgi:predicted small metal-binding protein
MNDPDIFARANALSEEEERLYEHASDGHGLSAEETDRLEAIKVELDRCYDLLHQRRARRAAGLDPAGAELRPGQTVEKYDQ